MKPSYEQEFYYYLQVSTNIDTFSEILYLLEIKIKGEKEFKELQVLISSIFYFVSKCRINSAVLKVSWVSLNKKNY